MNTNNTKMKIRITFDVIGLVAALVLSIAMSAKADFIFGIPENLGPTINTSANDLTPRMPADGLSLYFASSRAGGSGGYDVWVMTRSKISDPWGAPVNLGPTVNSSYDDYSLSISADSLSLYFVSNRPGGSGGYDIWTTTRLTTSDSWSAPMNLGPTVNSSSNEYSVGISVDELSLYFTSNRGGGSGGYDLWVITRLTTDTSWSAPANLGPIVNSGSDEWTLGVPVDNNILYIASNRSGGYGQLDLWVTRRATANSDWEEPVNLGPTVNSSSIDGYPITSADGHMFYFSSNRPGGSGNVDLWQVSIEPVCDFNHDNKVDSADMHIMVDHWGENYPFCDIGPTPFGDGIVDVQDLIVLSEHLFEEVLSESLVAYWKLDETEGDIAYDSAGGNFGTLSGNPIWQSDSGQVAGALQFDGLDDYISADKVLNPKFAEFSVFAWIKGGSPGQVIISQKNSFGGVGATWLGIDPVNGCLMTGLVSPPIGRFIAEPLESNFIITDDIWHHVGFVWDGSYRTLYVDGIEVAKDTNSLASLKNSDGGLYIGANKNLDAGTFFSGLIDDVRIYDIALTSEEVAALAQ